MKKLYFLYIIAFLLSNYSKAQTIDTIVIGSTICFTSADTTYCCTISNSCYATIASCDNHVYDDTVYTPEFTYIDYTVCIIEYNNQPWIYDTTNMEIISFVSINELSLDKSIKVYPNPGHDKMKIESSMRISRVVVTNSKGQKVFESMDDNTSTIDVSTYPKGMYIYSIYDIKGKLITDYKFIVD